MWIVICQNLHEVGSNNKRLFMGSGERGGRDSVCDFTISIMLPLSVTTQNRGLVWH